MNKFTISEMDLLDSKHEKEVEKYVTAHPVVKGKKLRLGGKKVCISLSIISIIFIWIVLLIPITVIIISVADNNQSAFSTVNNTIFNLLPPINVTSNYSNFTIERVECVDNFVYVPGDEICYPECDWNPSRDDSVRIVHLILKILSIFSIVLCTATLIAWLLLSCIDWKKFRFRYDFQLPRTSLFMVVMCSLFLVVLNASIDLMPRDFFFCQFTENGQSYSLPHLFYSISNISYNKIVLNVIGALYHYLFLVTIGWVILSLIDVNILLFFPFWRGSFRKKLLIFLIQCLVCFGINLIPVLILISVDPQSPYVASSFLISFSTLNIWTYLFLINMPLFLAPGMLISLTIVIVTKLRITSIESQKQTGHKIKLTDLEKKLIVYAIVLMALLLFQAINTIVLTTFPPEYFQFITKFILCMTVNSPILTLPSNLTGSNATLNDTVPVYRENPYGDVDACRMLESEASVLLPKFSFILFALLSRLIWLPIFFVLVPQITLKQLKTWYKSVKDSILKMHVP